MVMSMVIPWFLFIPAYYFLALFYLVFGVHNSKFFKCVYKCLPVAILMLQMLLVLVEFAGASSTDSKEDRIFGIRQFMWGITFSAVGDGCLVFRKVLLVGVISFGISLCFYISMLGFVESIANITLGGVACGLGVLFLSLIILVAFKKLPTSSAKTKSRSVITSLILVYFAVLSVLLWSATMLLLKQGDLAGLCSTVGAALFYISDILIVASAFWDARLLQGRALVMFTYYSAQLLLAYSMYLSLTTNLE